MIDSRWRALTQEAARSQRELSELALAALERQLPLPPRELSGDEIRLHRSFDMSQSSEGMWMVWCEYGPLSVGVLTAKSSTPRWTVQPQRHIVGIAPEDLKVEMREWFERAKLEQIIRPKRAEILQIIRAALARWPRGS